MSVRNLAALLLFVASASAFGVSRDRGWKTTLPGGQPPDEPRYFGWVDDPAAVRECLAELNCGTFRETPAFAAGRDRDRGCVPVGILRTVTGDLLPARDQKSVGDCVGFATASAIEFLSCVQIADGEAGEYRDLAQEVIYGGSRVEVGGGRIRGMGPSGPGRRSGSATTVWCHASTATTILGSTPKADAAITAASAYRTNLSRWRWSTPFGASSTSARGGVPRAIRNGYPVLVCSSQGFEMNRGADGFCTPRAVVSRDGRDRRSRRRTAGRVPPELVGTGSASRTAIPGRCAGVRLWADADVLDGMLGQGDSWAFSRFVGFPPR